MWYTHISQILQAFVQVESESCKFEWNLIHTENSIVLNRLRVSESAPSPLPCPLLRMERRTFGLLRHGTGRGPAFLLKQTGYFFCIVFYVNGKLFPELTIFLKLCQKPKRGERLYGLVLGFRTYIFMRNIFCIKCWLRLWAASLR